MNEHSLFDVSPVSPEAQHAAIARRAYETWVAHGCPRGTALQDWLEAEAEVAAEMSSDDEKQFHWPHLCSSGRHP